MNPSQSVPASNDAHPEFPAPPGRIVVICVTALALGIGFTRWLDSRGHDSVAAYLAAPVTIVRAERAGVIADVSAETGSEVAAGHPLATIEDAQGHELITRQQVQISLLEADLKQAESQAEAELAWKLQGLQDEIFATRLKSADLLKEQYQYELEQTALRDYLDQLAYAGPQDDPAFQSVLLGTLQHDEDRIDTVLRHEAAVNSAEVSAAQVEMCESRLAELNRLKAALPEQVRDAAGCPGIEAQLASARSELRRLEAGHFEQPVVSPATGTVGRLHCAPGSSVDVNEPLVELFDRERPYVIAQVPSRLIARLKLDQEVTVIFPGEQRRTGRVTAIAARVPHPAFEGEESARPGDRESLIPVRIEHAGTLWPTVPIGAQLEVQM